MDIAFGVYLIPLSCVIFTTSSQPKAHFHCPCGSCVAWMHVTTPPPPPPRSEPTCDWTLQQNVGFCLQGQGEARQFSLCPSSPKENQGFYWQVMIQLRSKVSVSPPN